MVQPVIGPNDREPSLLTHHEHNGSSPDDFDYDDGPYTGDQARFNEQGQDDDGYDDEPEYDENGKLKKPPLTPKQRKKRRWKIIRRVLYAMFGLFVVVPAIVFVIMYFSVGVPSPDSVAAQQNQAVTYYFSDGTTVMGKDTPPQGNRVILKYEQIPDIMRKAVYATEDATFETNSGFDITGILRAVYNQATGVAGGGSTISQQYIKQATGNKDVTLTRKATELVQSFKMNQTYSKNDIITAYLNTIYFGNGAYGVGAAAQTFYNKNVMDLNASEAALLAGLIQQPGRAGKPEVQQARWTVAIDRMVKNNFITQAERDSAVFPTPVERTEANQKEGEVNTFIKNRVADELANQGFTDEKLYAGGYKVVTTIDPKAQKAAEQAVADAMKGQTDPQILNALVATDPKTGGVLAYYGGPTLTTGPNGQQLAGRDRANEARNPGSSIKAFDLTAFLKLGKGLGETFDGTSPRTFPGVAKPVRNAGDSLNCGKECTVAAAMEVSANTVFYDMVLNVTKPGRVAQAARDAGVRESAQGGRSKLGEDNNISLGGGSTVATPEDMAAAYGTFANDGIRHKTHFVKKLTNSSDETAFEFQDENTPAFDKDAAVSKQIAGNVTEALVPVIKHSNLKCPTGHECAGKTGTQQYEAQTGDRAGLGNFNAQTWMVGYTPSVSAAAWVGGDGNKALKSKTGTPIFGATIAGPMWQNFMSLYLTGTPSEKFPAVKAIGKDKDAAPPTPTTTPTTPTTTTPTTTTPTTPTTPTDTNTQESTPTSPTRSRPGPNPPGLGNGGGPALGSNGGGSGGALLPNDPAG
jgi:membrane peptidoglycan carboxypeptidase